MEIMKAGVKLGDLLIRILMGISQKGGGGS